MKHAEVHIGDYKIPLIGISPDATLEQCVVCKKNFNLRQIILDWNGEPHCKQCSEIMLKKLYYFGCLKVAGHFLYENSSGHEVSARRIDIPGFEINQRLDVPDGIFPPGSKVQGKYLESLVPPLRIVAWWDYTGDERGGSNSNLIGFNYRNAEEMLDDAIKLFPTVMKRQPRPVPYYAVTDFGRKAIPNV
jgi:hypothetical protein